MARKEPRVAPPRCLHKDLRGRCSAPAGHGLFLNFCEEHAAWFAEVRGEIKASLKRHARWRQGDDDAELVA